MQNISIFSVGDAQLQTTYLDNWKEYQHYNHFKALKKGMRNDKPALVIACIRDEESEKLCKQVTQFIRDGLKNQDTRIVLIHEPSFELDEVSWMEDLRVNACLSADINKISRITSTLNREVDTFLHIDTNSRQHDAETSMLMCITQFSRDKQPLAELLRLFSESLSTLCFSSFYFHAKVTNDNQGEIDYCNYAIPELIAGLKKSFGLPTLPSYFQSTLDEKKPQINLLPESIDLEEVEKNTELTIGSYLTFPITVYSKTLYLLVYFIPEVHMDKVSMKQINIVTKACEQLTMLLERRQAESSLKKQYQRLKNALVELKSTKQELQHKEKMADIGQMAAGIAHEINNPLSFVMSNFASMDEYLSSIIQLQDLQSKFLASIEVEEDQKIKTLKQNIAQFEQEEDIDFILTDIRSVVTESHNGLKRVKDIITDLKSFTYSQSSVLEICNISQVIDDTLKVLSYELHESIVIKKNLASMPSFMAHNGLMQQVLVNLIKNAGQALIDAKSETPTITLTTKHEGNSVFIIVHDNGPGISESAKGKIFEPFYTTKKVGEGTGLGLSVTFNIIKKLNGAIRLDSKPNKYTRFIITFPMSKEQM